MKQATPKKQSGATPESYDNLKHFYAHAQSLFHIKSIMGMDMMTVMPPRAAAQRIHDIAGLTKRVYAETITKQVLAALEDSENDFDRNPGDWNAWDRRNLEEMRWIYDNLAAVPPDLFLASIRVSNEGRRRYSEAYKANDWNGIKGWLKDVIDLNHRIIGYKQKLYGTKSHYETLLAGYMRDMKEKDLTALLDSLNAPIRAIADEVLERQKRRKAPQGLSSSFSKAEQMRLNYKLLQDMGFDFERGTLSVTSYEAATAGGHCNEARILIGCRDNGDILQSIEDSLYQGAKGIYIQGLPEAWLYQPVGNTPDTVVMEAHSLLIETIIGRMPQFFSYLVRTATDMFPDWRSGAFEAENLYHLKKIVKFTAARRDADELSRFFHGHMRTGIERDIINGTLKVDDLPERWAADSKEFLGVEPKTPAQGCLQCQDWFMGRFGYFPVSIVSHVSAAQLEDALFKTFGNLPDMVEKGEFSQITGWLRENLHGRARLKNSLETIAEASGADLSGEALLTHLNRRYLKDKE